MNLDFRSEMALAGACAFAAGRKASHSDTQCGCAPAQAADDTTVTETVTTMAGEPAKLLARAS